MPRRRWRARTSTPTAPWPARRPGKPLRQAVTQIIIADVSMSIDNVLGVAGAAREHPVVLVFGLALVDPPDGRRLHLHRQKS
jgi:predicted tellurium resistance membrane protein TerC